ncbi:unnamed protein product [Arabidopsis thaliana]|uniref:folate gamma-glutamyl hydrolase n=1 Tax=Arabidopsis thaliana TaxID=3702 RepID=A0A5S9WVJ5_ARATH|nr:unnamed protein product [Arabidopsis thaliana]
MWRFCFFLSLLFFDVSAVKSAESIFLPSQIGVEDSRVFESLSLSPVCSAADPNLNYKPVIGILTHPGEGRWDARLHSLKNYAYATNISYIAASYVKLAETGGARVIPLIYNEPEEILFQKLELVNGVIFTGGWAKTGLYYDVVEKIFNNRDILERFNSVNYASSLQFFKNVNIEATVFQRFPPELLKKLSADCLVMQNHYFGISPDNFQGNPYLSSFFNIVTTSADKDSKTFVSTIRSKRYPVTAFQWHPEKNAFEWGSSEIPHSEDAIQVTQHAANYLVSEARKSMNRPSSEKVLSNLIYNYKPTYSGYKGSGDDEVYIFT